MKKLQKEDPTVTESSALTAHYSVGRLLHWGALAYTQAHLYKALSLMSNHPECYSAVKDVAFWSSYDPTFSFAAAIMVLNYQLLQQSRHPFLVNVRQHWSPFSKAVFVLYGSGIAMVLPQTYLISYAAFGATHLIANCFMRAVEGAKVPRWEQYLRDKDLHR